MIAPYPTMNPALLNEAAEHTYDTIKQVIATIQDVRGVQTIPKKPDVIIRIADKATEQLLISYSEQICARARLNTLTVGHQIASPLQVAGGFLTLPGGVNCELLIDLKEVGTLGKDQARIQKRLQELAAQIERDEKTLANAQFLAKAPPHEVEKIRARHRDCQAERKALEGST
jgi:valyl-tRNA synthetase